jgi:hypothetical protein
MEIGTMDREPARKHDNASLLIGMPTVFPLKVGSPSWVHSLKNEGTTPVL